MLAEHQAILDSMSALYLHRVSFYLHMQLSSRKRHHQVFHSPPQPLGSAWPTAAAIDCGVHKPTDHYRSRHRPRLDTHWSQPCSLRSPGLWASLWYVLQKGGWLGWRKSGKTNTKVAYSKPSHPKPVLVGYAEWIIFAIRHVVKYLPSYIFVTTLI